MAAPPLPRLARLALLGAAIAAATLALATALYWLGGWIGSSIPRNASWEEPESGITILVETNGTHTGIVMPVITPHKDWRESFPGLIGAHGGEVTHVAVGWGEREVFLHVATWDDLGAITALRIAVLGGKSLIRVSHYVRPAPSRYHRPLRLSPRQYLLLVQRIEASLAPVPADGQREILRGTYAADDYYEARGRYTLFKTSNSWTGDVLGDAGVRMGLWTPFAGGVMKWIEVPGDADR